MEAVYFLHHFYRAFFHTPLPLQCQSKSKAKIYMTFKLQLCHIPTKTISGMLWNSVVRICSTWSPCQPYLQYRWISNKRLQKASLPHVSVHCHSGCKGGKTICHVLRQNFLTLNRCEDERGTYRFSEAVLIIYESTICAPAGCQSVERKKLNKIAFHQLKKRVKISFWTQKLDWVCLSFNDTCQRTDRPWTAWCIDIK